MLVMGTWRVWVIGGCLLLALLGYYQPWYVHDTAGFTMHAFDLAEFASLHPAVRSSSPPMVTSFLLRVPQLMLVVAFALLANGWRDTRLRWLVRALALALALRFLPPSDFFTSARDDPNYRQMTLLTGLGFAALLLSVLMALVPERWQRWLLAGVLLVGIVSGWMGLSRTDALMDNFEIGVSYGYGVIGFSAVSAVACVAALWPVSGAARSRQRVARSPAAARQRNVL